MSKRELHVRRSSNTRRRSRTASRAELGTDIRRNPVHRDPRWLDFAVPLQRMRMSVESDAAFGTGRHESTQLMIEALENTRLADATLVDVGCGSGILSMAAQLLGAARVFACDLDSNAVEQAGKQLMAPLFLGSADALRTESADVVLANLTAAVLDAIAHDLTRVVKPGGRLIVSGFISENPPIELRPNQVFELNDWLCWICYR